MSENEHYEEPAIKELKSLSREKQPSANIEERLIASLRQQGLIGSRPSLLEFVFARPVTVSLILLALILGGFLFGKQYGRPAVAQSSHPLFVLLLYESEQDTAAGGERVQEYADWIRGVRESGRVATGEKLKESGRVLQMVDGGLRIQEGARTGSPPSVLGGYFLIEAANYQDAVRIAAECPHLKHGGLIELREIEATKGG